MSPGGEVNIQKLFSPVGADESLPPAAPKTATESDASADSWTVSVGAVELRNYGAIFEDRTTARPEYVDVENLNLKVKDIRIPILACFLLGIRTPDQLEKHPLRGAIFENYVVCEVLKASLNAGRRPRMSFFRDHQGHEVDFKDYLIHLR